jgi:hypothetical protein
MYSKCHPLALLQQLTPLHPYLVHREISEQVSEHLFQTKRPKQLETCITRRESLIPMKNGARVLLYMYFTRTLENEKQEGISCIISF